MFNNPAHVLAEQWHGGQWSGLYALQCGATDADTFARAAAEFRECVKHADTEREKSALRVAARYCETELEKCN